MIQMLNAVKPAGALCVFGLGLLIGSFMNVCIYRWPREKSVVKGRSFCTKCEKMIAWYDNVPLLSFLVLGGKCRQCTTPISWRYPAVELLAGVSAVLIFLSVGLNVKFIFWTYFVYSLIIATWVDFEHQIIPDEVSIMGILLGMTASFAFPELQGVRFNYSSLGISAAGMLTGVWMLWGVAMLGEFLFKKEAMGGGDLKLLGMIGAFLGWEKVVLTFFAAPFFALPFALAQMITKKEHVIPYGPYLSLAAIFSWVWGEKILSYLLLR